MAGGAAGPRIAPVLTDAEWAAFLAKAVPGIRPDAPFVYAEPQYSPNVVAICMSCGVDWFTPRATICAEPAVPCCCAPLFLSCTRACVGNVHVERISEPHAWFLKLLRAKDPRCPEALRGVFWMHGNNVPETLLTLQDSAFDETGRRGLKRGATGLNWSHDPTCCGVCLAHPCLATFVDPVRIEMSPDGKWVVFDLGSIGGRALAYVVQPGETWRREDGSTLPAVPGDLIRHTYARNLDPTSTNTFMYHMRRVAELDAYVTDSVTAGEPRLVLRPAYDELRALATAQDRHPGYCGGYCVLGRSQEQMLAQWRLYDDRQIIRYAADSKYYKDGAGAAAPAPVRAERR